MKTINDLERPDFVTFLASVPADPELERLGDLYAASIEQVATLEARTATAREELARIDARLMTAPDEQSKLLTQRVQTMAALDVFPAQLAEALRRRGMAHLYWLAGLRRVALQEVERATIAVAPHLETVKGIRRKLARDDQNGAGHRNIAPAEREAMATQRTATIDEMRHDHEQLQRAREVAAVAQGRAGLVYGDTIDLAAPGLWAEAIERRTRQVNPPYVRAYVRA